MKLADKYAYRVFWSEEDEMFVGACSELGHLSHLDSTQEGALAGIRQVVSDTLEIFQTEGREIPQPMSVQKFSGTFTVRVPPDLHRRLFREASEAHVSLNRLVGMKLAS